MFSPSIAVILYSLRHARLEYLPTYCITCSGICKGCSKCTIQSFFFSTFLMKPINHKLHEVVEIILQPTRIEQSNQRIFKLVTEHLADRGICT